MAFWEHLVVVGRGRGCVVEEGQREGHGDRTSISLPKTLSCISGGCLEASQRAKRLELRGRLTAAQRTLRHLTIGTAIQTTHTHIKTHVQTCALIKGDMHTHPPTPVCVHF